MELGEKLKIAREKKHLSQAYVAEHLHISRQAISKWENDHTCPDITNLQALSKLYSITLDELLADVTKEHANQTIDIPEISEEALIKNAEKNIERKNIYILLFSLLALVSCSVPPLGVIINIIIILLNKKIGISSKCLYIICCVCLIVSLFSTLVILNNITSFYFWGSDSIEKVALLN